MSKRRTPKAKTAPQPVAVPSCRERRHYPRLAGMGLMANIAGRLVKVLQVSATGLTLERRFEVGRGEVGFTLYPSDGKRLDLNSGMRAQGVVVHEAEACVGLRFQPASLALVKFVASHMP